MREEYSSVRADYPSSGRWQERENWWLMTIRQTSLLDGHDGV